jgi:hypothetical protein
MCNGIFLEQGLKTPGNIARNSSVDNPDLHMQVQAKVTSIAVPAIDLRFYNLVKC